MLHSLIRRYGVSYRVQLKLRLEDLKTYNVPKECSSCFHQPAPHRQVLTTEHRVGKQTRVQWMIQLPLCETCYQMQQVLDEYRPSQHGPPERAQGNRRATLAMVILVFLLAIGLWLPASSVPELGGSSKFWSLAVLGVVLVGVYYWNWRANQRAQLTIYRDMVVRAAHEFGKVEVEDEKQGPILTFDDEAFGHAFEESNRDLLITDLPS
jgi:hypothetical protein